MAITNVHSFINNPVMYVHLSFLLTFSIYVKLFILLPFISKMKEIYSPWPELKTLKEREKKHKSFEFSFYAACQNRLKLKVIAVHWMNCKGFFIFLIEQIPAVYFFEHLTASLDQPTKKFLLDTACGQMKILFKVT